MFDSAFFLISRSNAAGLPVEQCATIPWPVMLGLRRSPAV
jgi:hypothetical protein